MGMSLVSCFFSETQCTVRTFNKQSPKTVFSNSTLLQCLSTIITHQRACTRYISIVSTEHTPHQSFSLLMPPPTHLLCLPESQHSRYRPEIPRLSAVYQSCDHHKHNALPQQSVVLRSGWVLPSPVCVGMWGGAPTGWYPFFYCTSSFGVYGTEDNTGRSTASIIPPFVRRMPFLPQHSQFILVWDSH